MFCIRTKLKTGEFVKTHCMGQIEYNSEHPTIIFIHGALVNSFIWAQLNQTLKSKNINFLMMDLIGHGGSSKLNREITNEDYLLIFANILNSFRIQRVGLVGCDVGLQIAMTNLFGLKCKLNFIVAIKCVPDNHFLKTILKYETKKQLRDDENCLLNHFKFKDNVHQAFALNHATLASKTSHLFCPGYFLTMVPNIKTPFHNINVQEKSWETVMQDIVLPILQRYHS